MNFTMIIRRFLAFWIDWIVLWGGAYGVLALGLGKNTDLLMYPSFELFASPTLYLFLIWILVFILFKDCLFKGRSLGKMICKLVIVNAQNPEQKASFKALVIRNLTFIILQIELIIVLVNKGVRVGDMLANTRVVSAK